MKAKTIVEMATLMSSFYAITKDKEMREDVMEMIMKGKEKIGKTVGDLVGDDKVENAQLIIGKLFEKAKEVKDEVEHKIEEVAEKVYHKMHIANIHEIENLQKQIDQLKAELAKASKA